MFLIRILQKLIVPLMVIVCIMLIIMLQLGFVFLLIAMLPSIAAYFVDEDADRITFRTIFACNLAATIPTLTPVFISGLKFKHYDITSTFARPDVWMFIYGAAAAAWGMIHFSRAIARAMLEVQYKLRTASLEKAQERLLTEWGETLQPKAVKK